MLNTIFQTIFKEFDQKSLMMVEIYKPILILFSKKHFARYRVSQTFTDSRWTAFMKVCNIFLCRLNENNFTHFKK